MCGRTTSPRPAGHLDTTITYGTLGEPRKYMPTYPFDGDFIDDFHRRLATAPRRDACIEGLPISGRLRPEDALKLYECGYFADGDLLELGTGEGLSTWILARSLIASGKGAAITTIEVSRWSCLKVQRNLKRGGVGSVVELRRGDANETCPRLAADGRRFAFAFVDHSHAYEHVASACTHLERLLAPGGVAVFHDYNDRRNTTRTGVGESHEEYGVFAAVQEALDDSRFELLGVYGCCGVVRRGAGAVRLGT